MSGGTRPRVSTAAAPCRAGQRSSSRTATSSEVETSVADARPVTHCTRLASHTSPITLVIARSSSVGATERRPLLGLPHRGEQHPADVPADDVDLGGHRRVREHERSRQRLGQVRLALQHLRGPPEHEHHPVGGGVTGDRLAVQGLAGLLELEAERRDQQVDLGGEVAVERPEGHVGALGDRAHLHLLETALGGERDGGVQDPAAPLPLGVGPEILVGQRVGSAHGGSRRPRMLPVG